MWNPFKRQLSQAIIEVEDEEVCNPVKELIHLYRERIATLEKEKHSLQIKLEHIQEELLTVKANFSTVPHAELPVIKHFNTFSGLKAELEARSLREKKEADEAKIIINSK